MPSNSKIYIYMHTQMHTYTHTDIYITSVSIRIMRWGKSEKKHEKAIYEKGNNHSKTLNIIKYSHAGKQSNIKSRIIIISTSVAHPLLIVSCGFFNGKNTFLR